MRTLEEIRKYEVLMPDGSWQLVHWEQLDVGDVVRSLNPDGTLENSEYLVNPFMIDDYPALKVIKPLHLGLSVEERKRLEEKWGTPQKMFPNRK